MKTVWPSEGLGKAAWGEAYEGPMNAIKIDLTQKTMRQIHAVILQSNSLQEAAGRLGVTDATLRNHLGKVTYLDAQGMAQSLTYEVMKTVWPSEEVGKAAWNEAYEEAMKATKRIDLTQKTMRQIHAVILQSNSLQEAAGRLGVGQATLQRHLGKVTYLDAQGMAQPLTYEAMKTVWPSEEVGKAAWGEAYEEPMKATKRIDLTQKTIRQIHAAILQSNSLQEAAGRLGVTDATLRSHLGKVTYLDAQGIAQPLTYEAMKTVWPSEEVGKAAWGEAYEGPMKATKRIDLSQKTMRQIHAVILQSNSLQEAAGRLGVRDTTLQRHLGKVTYLDAQGMAQPLTYEAMRTVWPSEEVGKAAWGEAYEELMKATKRIDLTQKTMRQIHAVILQSNSLQEAAGRLGVAHATLRSHLGKVTYLDAHGTAQPLTYEAMKTVWPNEEVGKAAWNEAYEEPMNAIKIDLTQKTMRQIHAAILQSNSLQEAAGRLGVRDTTLQRHLGKVTYLDAQGMAQPLTYEVMKTVWPSEEVGKAAWGEAYEEPMNVIKIDLTQKTMRQIHAVILQSNSLQEAAGRLGVGQATLQRHLGKVTYLDAHGVAKPLTYEVMKTVWPSEEVGKAAWREAYDGLMDVAKINRTDLDTIVADDLDISASSEITDTIESNFSQDSLEGAQREVEAWEEAYDELIEVAKINRVNLDTIVADDLDISARSEITDNIESNFSQDSLEGDQIIEAGQGLTPEPSVSSAASISVTTYAFFKETHNLKRKLPPKEIKAMPLNDVATIIFSTNSVSEAAEELETTPDLLITSLLEAANIDYEDIKSQTEKYKALSFVDNVLTVNIMTSSATAKSQRIK
ncbi:hypothetical protein ACNVED_10275 [Legionella sp. D16C41]|uniref:hypothetical protein n=1 Tax=Legionella sp. D16C41 TaxID=3402688 RepID=UPI003AF56814